MIVTIPSWRAVQIMEDGENKKAEYYLSIRVEDLTLSQFAEHFRKVQREDESVGSSIEDHVRKACAEFPNGRLFFFDTSEEQWKALGGEKGYAIMRDGRIDWRMRIKKS